ncbi:MAG: methylenetetrahydrofolate--tRNA-(uracil(54)-C(5))-methyltransferase (FADH(2)-oxidizing) TrmFO [Clostridia bacterium]|nr:methylenetetrahydrofolate--tRNA-(uracil(54)-C(5))-methyltransferase (FADH(2)-oxidizing) TrmFO [Clostridia bacterium]
MKVSVIGAGLAGCEASLQLANAGIQVDLYDIKPQSFTPAHVDPNFCELVCSNSLKSDTLDFATGLLKQEMRMLDCQVLDMAYRCRVPAGKTLSVDRQKFASMVTEAICSNPLINVICREVTTIPDGIVIIATGPLTTHAFSEHLRDILGQDFYFYDAIAPIISADSIDMQSVFVANKFDNSQDGDYINCPMTKSQYEEFCTLLVNAERVKLHDFEDPKVFEGCMPVEVMANRDINTLRCGPLKSNGLVLPDGTTPYACVQLRKENIAGDAYNMVGFQTNLTYPEQKRIFRTIPGLENCEFLRYGVMHRNTYINAPRHLNHYFQLKSNPNVFFAGQISGIEGYVESIASGLMVGINVSRYIRKMPLIEFTINTCLGALGNYLESASEHNFQPMHINWGLLMPINVPKAHKKQAMCDRALAEITKIKETI